MSQNHIATSNQVPQYQQRSIDTLSLPKREVKTHSRQQIRKIASSIEAFGFNNPILIKEDGQIICGIARYYAAKELGYASIPVLVADYLSDEAVRSYRIAENKLGELSEWDEDILRLEFNDLISLDIDLELTGFETYEIDALLFGGETEEQDEEILPPVPLNPASRAGDLWGLGKHRLYCGDARDSQSYDTLMDGALAQMVFSDPPYNVKIGGNVCGKGRIKHTEFAMASGEMSEAAFTEFLTDSLQQIADNSLDGSIHYICMDWKHMREMLSAGHSIYSELKNLCVWVKTNGGMGSFYRSQHELVFAFKKGTSPHINNFELGQHGRNRTNVWEYAGINSMKPERMAELAMHPTVKPLEMIKDAILDCSKPGGIILDAFMGSGTTLIAAEATGRVAYGIEYEPAYLDVILNRYQMTTGLEPVLISSLSEDIPPQTSFTDIAAVRSTSDCTE